MPGRAVILAGGKGSRLSPYTTVIPKPLLPIDDRPILDVVVHQLENAGFDRLTLAVGHLAHLITAVMGDGSRLGVTIDYHEEDEPLGTVGALATIDGLGDDTFLVMNGDVLTALDYARLVDVHRAAGNALTIASHQRIVETDYGVLRVGDEIGETVRIVGFDEKPKLEYTVSMGVYVMEPRVLSYIHAGQYLDLPDLVIAMLEAGEQVASYPYDGYWLDIGRHDDYGRAIEEFERMKPELLG